MKKHPNLVYIFSDQHRAEATSYMGNPDVKTPIMDSLAREGISFNMAVSNAPVCGPARASLLTGQLGVTNGVFVNDVNLNPEAVTIGKVFKNAGYDTAYIGKWHLDGYGRLSFIPKEHRQGFDFWRAMECTHNYNNSYFYADDSEIIKWEGYDAEAQAKCASGYIRNRNQQKPFVLFLSWGPPHSPYHTAPRTFRTLYDPEELTLRPNVPHELEFKVKRYLAGYYSHITTLDSYLGIVWNTLIDEGIEGDTIFIYTSDHGDMLGSQGHFNKQRPWDESIRVPFLLRYPALFGSDARQIEIPFSTIDIMPTLLDLCGVEIPDAVEGISFAPYLEYGEPPKRDAALIECVHPFGQWLKQDGGKEFRGIRTPRYTYVQDLSGPWLLYDNLTDPYQLGNLIGTRVGADLLPELNMHLQNLLKEYRDEFLSGERYIEKWGYTVDETGTVPYSGYDPDGE